MLNSKFHNHSIKIEDFKINPINPGGGSGNFKPITRNVLICPRCKVPNFRVIALKLKISKLTLSAPKGGVKLFKLILGMPYIMPKL